MGGMVEWWHGGMMEWWNGGMVEWCLFSPLHHCTTALLDW